MKKFKLLLSVCFLSLTMFAQNYNHQVNTNVNVINGYGFNPYPNNVNINQQNSTGYLLGQLLGGLVVNSVKRNRVRKCCRKNRVRNNMCCNFNTNGRRNNIQLYKNKKRRNTPLCYQGY